MRNPKHSAKDPLEFLKLTLLKKKAEAKKLNEQFSEMTEGERIRHAELDAKNEEMLSRMNLKKTVVHRNGSIIEKNMNFTVKKPNVKYVN